MRAPVLRWGVAPAGVVVLLGVAHAADFEVAGQSFHLAVTETLDVAYHDDNDNNQDPRDPSDHEADDRYGHIFNILDVSLAWRDWALGGQLDVYGFIEPPRPAPDRVGSAAYRSRYLTRVTPEKLYLTLARPAFDLHLGDFHVSFGRGLALHLVTQDTLSEDTTIRGGRITVHWGGSEVTMLAGEANALNLDQETGYRVEDPDEIILGGRLEQQLLEPLRLGLHGVYVLNDTGEETFFDFHGHDYDLIVGGNLELDDLWSCIDAYVEADVQRTRRFGTIIRGPGTEIDEGLPGLAFYGAATASLGSAELLTEFAYYDGFELKATLPLDSPRDVLYHRPPTLERIDVLVEDNTQLWGARGRLDWQLDELRLGGRQMGQLHLHANYSYFHNWYTLAVRIQHPFAGLDWTAPDDKTRLYTSFGRRWESNRETGTAISHTWQLDWSLQRALGRRFDATLEGLYRARSAPAPSGSVRWTEFDVSLSVKWSPYLTVSGSYEFSDEFQLDPAVPHHYVSGSAKIFVGSTTNVRLQVGRTRGGLKCIAGVCRIYPPFAGVRLTVVTRL